jgi:hypothetical protein
MLPVLGTVAAAAIPTLASMLMGGGSSAPSGPDYSQILALVNSPEMRKYREQMLQNAFSPQSDLMRIASDQAYAQANRAAASRGLGTSGAGLGFVQSAQTNLANKFLEGETQRQIQAFNAATNSLGGIAGNMMNMANNQYNADMARWQAGQDRTAGIVGGLTGMAQAGLSAYGRQNELDRLNSMMTNFATRTPGYGGSAAAYVGGVPVSGGNYNY